MFAPVTPQGYTVSSKLLTRDDFQEACRARDFGRVFKLMSQWDGVSQDKIAAPVEGLTQSRVSKIMRGADRVATVEVMERIADALHIPGAYLGLAPRGWEGDTLETATTAHLGIPGSSAHLTDVPGAPVAGEANPGEVVDRSLDVVIDVDREGRIRLHYVHEFENRSDRPFTRFPRQFWFKHTTGPILVEPDHDGSDRHVLIQRQHDIGIHVRWACQLFPAINPGETGRVAYTCTGGQFSSELYWRQTVYRPTGQLHLQMRLAGVEALTGCQAVEERPDGSEITATESLSWNTDENGIVIDLNRRDLRTNQCVTLRWDVPRATA